MNERQNANNKNNTTKNGLVLFNPRTGVAKKEKHNCLGVKVNQTETRKSAPPELKINVNRPPGFCEMRQMIYLELEESRYHIRKRGQQERPEGMSAELCYPQSQQD